MKDVTEFECESCSNEPKDKINLARFFAKLDEIFSRGDLAAAGRLIEYWERDARSIGDENGLLYVLNEETGFFRRTGEKEKGLAAVEEALALAEKLGICETVSGATVIINCATTMKAFGEAEKPCLSMKRLARSMSRLLTEAIFSSPPFITISRFLWRTSAGRRRRRKCSSLQSER